MFKKDVGVKNYSNLKNTERRNLFKSYPQYKTPSVVKKSVFKNQVAKGVVYADERLKPTWFRLNDSEDLIPTVYTLWDNPGLIPVVRTHEFVIEDHILGGANLMLPGTVPPFGPELTEGAVVGIVSTSQDLVCMAVGILTRDLHGLDRVVGTTGVAVKVLHYYRDELYRSYDVERLEVPTNDKLEPLLVVPELEELKEEVGVAGEVGEVGEVVDVVDVAEVADVAETQDNIDEDKSQTTAEETTTTDSAVNIDDAAEALAELSVQDIDHFFHRSLLYSLTQDQIQVPINASNLMSNHINKNLQIDSNIKKTSYKKTAKWLKHLEKEGYLKLKGKGDDLVIVDVIKKEKSDELKNFVPYKVKKNSSGSSTAKPTPSAKSSQLQVTNLFKPQQRTMQFFERCEADFFAYYTQPELKKLLEQFIKKEQLVSPKNPKLIVISDLLGTVIKQKGSSTIARDQIMGEFLTKNFSKFYQVTYLNGKKSDLYRGEMPKIKIIMETPMGNKQVTKIQVKDFEIYNMTLKEFNSELKIKCSSSTTINDTLLQLDGTHNPRGFYEIMVQGAHDRIVIDLLTKKYGLSVSWIEVENKLKNRRKKR